MIVPEPQERPVYARPPLNQSTLPMVVAAAVALATLAYFIGVGFQFTAVTAGGIVSSSLLLAVGIYRVAATRRRHAERLATPSAGYGDQDEELLV